MTHTALELFPGWYSKGLNKEVPSDEMNIRKKAIQEMLKIDDITFWIKLSKVYLGKFVFSSKEYAEILIHVKFGDDNFPIQNENIVRLLSGCAIAEKIDQQTTYISDFLALSILTTETSTLPVSLISDLRDRAYEYWVNEAESKRKMNLTFKNVLGSLNSGSRISIPEITADPITHKPHSDAVVKVIGNVQRDLNTTNAEINSLKESFEAIIKNFVALSEESNVLWWLFGGYSSIAKSSFTKLTPELLSIVISLELNRLSNTLPGIGGIESIIHKALSSVQYEIGSTHSVDSIVESIVGHEEAFKGLVPKLPNVEMEFFTPLLFAIQTRLDYSGAEWKSVYKKHLEFDLAYRTTYDAFSFQLYKELMLIDTYKQC